jgi:mRNA-degrading endonuclease toxin of MazEF toxin-antitoxin module
MARVSEPLSAADEWLRAARSSARAAVVLGASVTGLSYVRSLSRRGIAVLLLDGEKTAAAHTRLAEFALLPSVVDRPDEAVGFLNGLESRLDRPAALFATSDGDVLFLAVHGAWLGAKLRFLVPDPSEAYVMLRGEQRKAMADQIATVEKQRLKGRIGQVTPTDMADVERAIRVQLGL